MLDMRKRSFVFDKSMFQPETAFVLTVDRRGREYSAKGNYVT